MENSTEKMQTDVRVQRVNILTSDVCIEPLFVTSWWIFGLFPLLSSQLHQLCQKNVLLFLLAMHFRGNLDKLWRHT